jgi:methylated-DNA-[protein]-cysteine S-methyltransferase
MKNIFYYQTDIGKIALVEEDENIINLYFEGETLALEEYSLKETIVINQANKQLQEYLRGERLRFQLPLAPAGTNFFQSVWDRLLEIPYGKTKSYKEIAESIGKRNACRAVGNANNKNPIPIIIPCHRVISADGGLAGYRGGIQIKAYLLEMEKNNKKCLEPRQEEKNTL